MVRMGACFFTTFHTLQMNGTRRRSISFTYTTRQGRSISFSKETEEGPGYRNPPIFATSHNYAHLNVYVPPPVHPRGPYSRHPHHQPTPSIVAYPQQYTPSHITYNPPSSARLVKPQRQIDNPQRSPFHPTVPSPGVNAKEIQTWVNGTAPSNTSSSKRGRSHSQYAAPAQDLINPHEDQKRKRKKEKTRRDSVYTPSHRSGTCDGSQAGGRTPRPSPRPVDDHVPNGPHYPVETYWVDGQLQTRYVVPPP